MNPPISRKKFHPPQWASQGRWDTKGDHVLTLTILASGYKRMTDLNAFLHHCYKHGLLLPSNVESCIKESCLIHATKDNGGAEVQLHSFLTLATKWRRVVNSTPQSLYHQGITPYPLNKRLGGPTTCLDISKKRKIACLYWGPKPVILQHVAVTIAHSFTQTGQQTKTSNQHTLQSPVYIMYRTVCCNASSPWWYMELFSIESVCLVDYISNCIFSSHLN